MAKLASVRPDPLSLDVSGTIKHTGIVLDLCDRRLKQNIEPISTSSSKFSTSCRSATRRSRPPEFGLIAQDVEKLFPQLVLAV